MSLPLIGAATGAVTGVTSLLGNKGKFDMVKSFLDQGIADYTQANTAQLGERQANDEALLQQILSQHGGLYNQYGAANDRDFALMDSVAPGGEQEGRFGNLITGYGDDVKRSFKFGMMDQQRADKANRARMGLIGGPSTREQSMFQSQLGRYNAGVDADIGKMRLDNASKFLGLGMGTIGQRQGLTGQLSEFGAKPLQYQAATDALTGARANNLMGLVSGNTYFTKKDKKLNAFDYISGALGGAMSGASMGMLGGGGGGGAPSGGGGGMFG